ncbi:type II toxin-antitoxin system YafQ family toxin [Mobiluncus mulieris]|uniref:Addiction module toxin, RelE/StbE family n=3 Tax=Mobiluncus mulieris TaxID=2052 RepID=E0QPS6_9ACTO|nr:type II toxin-antitoxin system YafQ family toxin [Mobiluncus mulieris]EFM46306.1 addiction module toxin, RelE/StbE family [Mobiluncus mulieris ATCC 35239]MBB5846725.1 mRNA interferase YafQ [Mobiluncus mulieris]MCU9971434.1 type II toxin-antitoxin system YafQ family toxin [Mobiluncus mulieris]MCU9976492.1 type II toxin-antitoxin system YafQ family toxin [Mobiluncus mulieris]MCU9993031.1 type II toxin-antitoxin system YafQ family toxin [Mobiluncus mulieris]
MKLEYTAKFKKDYKKCLRQGRDMRVLEEVLRLLVQPGTLPARYRDHGLVGNYRGHRECHLAPDWLLIYRIDQDKVTLTATRLGSHSELFGQ